MFEYSIFSANSLLFNADLSSIALQLERGASLSLNFAIFKLLQSKAVLSVIALSPYRAQMSEQFLRHKESDVENAYFS